MEVKQPVCGLKGGGKGPLAVGSPGQVGFMFHKWVLGIAGGFEKIGHLVRGRRLIRVSIASVLQVDIFPCENERHWHQSVVPVDSIHSADWLIRG